MEMTCSFGELLIRYSPHLSGEWIKCHNMPAYVGGAELNVAHALAKWQLPVKYLTALPDHYLTHDILQHLQSAGIHTDGISLQGDRIGAYFLPQGADLKQAGVIYDRAGSAFASLQPGTLDWNTLLEKADWFHFSAISPALNPTAAAVCLEAVKAAKKMGLTVSIDLNYRAMLWRYGQSPEQIMSQLLPYCDVVMGNIWSAKSLLDIGFDASTLEVNSKDSCLAAAAQSARNLMKAYPNVQQIANTFRFTTDNRVSYFASLHINEQLTASATYTTESVVDKVGSGDCFMAALIRGNKEQKNKDYIINFAAAAAVGKLQEMGDHTTQTVAAIEAKMKSND